jgi:hypothetical protein
MALYLPDYNALLVYAPLTGGNLVAKTLTKTLGVNVARVGYTYSHKDLVGPLRFRHQPYTFTFVRHPIDWYVAFWRERQRGRWQLREPDAVWHPTWDIEPRFASDTLAEFVSKVTENRPGYLSDTFRLYTGRGTADEVHYVGKYETLADDLHAVLDTIGVSHSVEQLPSPRRMSHKRRKAALPRAIATAIRATEHDTLTDYGYETTAR